MEINHHFTKTFFAPEKDTTVLKQVFIRSNWRLILIVFCLTFIGILMIGSATFHSGSTIFISKQLLAFLVGIILLFIFSIINYQIFQPYFLHIYGICIFLLILVLLIGTTYRGTRAWIDFKLFSFQPSEIVRVLFILTLAGFFDKYYLKNIGVKRFIIPALLFAFIVFFLLLEPDFSAIVVYIPIIIVSFYLSGINKKVLSYILLFSVSTVILFLIKTYLFINKDIQSTNIFKFLNLALSGINIQYFIMLALTGLVVFIFWWILRKLLFRVDISYLLLTIFILWLSHTIVSASYKFVKPYQQRRLVAFLNPYFDPAGAGYQIIQTKIAIGSGRFFGKGLFKSTQAKLGFVPEKHTDFIFSLISEELGFLGSSVVVILYLLLILEIIHTATTARDSYGAIISSSIAAMFGFYFVVNIGMCLGISPVIGLPLPFLSYGGSNLISSYISVGLINSIYIRRYIY
ncbi:MAG: FtsW/RodA/SpoVE family cell cycle protein [Endomicrobia bacterium]|nr:FtsW/RodA/SpoVE family cell cycle protein [Endomicrobiia bacterium]